MGARPLSKISGSAPGKKERSCQAGRERGRVGRESMRAGRQAVGDGGHADPVLLNTFHLVLTYSTREWDTTLL